MGAWGSSRPRHRGSNWLQAGVRLTKVPSHGGRGGFGAVLKVVQALVSTENCYRMTCCCQKLELETGTS